MLETAFESIGGRRVRVARLDGADAGARGRPPVVLLHGYPDNLQIWSALAPLLAERRPVIAFDWPGMGFSETWAGGATPDHQADRLLSLVDGWGLERVCLVGMDMGGQPALSFAARHAGRTAGLVVMNSLVLADERTSWEIRVLRRFGWNRFLLRRAGRLVFEQAVRTSLPRGDRLPGPLRADLWAAFGRREVRDFVARMCAGYQGTLPKLLDLYPRIACPTLVLWGGRDRHFPPGHGRRLHEAMPGSALRILPEGEHWMAWHQAGDVAAAIEEWDQTCRVR